MGLLASTFFDSREEIKVENIAKLMMQNKEIWTRIENAVTKILKIREEVKEKKKEET